MKRAISWLADNADAVIGLGLAFVASIVGLFGKVPQDVVANVTVLTLATLAFVMLRDRHRAETSAMEIERSVTHASGEMLRQFAEFRERPTVRILRGREIGRELAESRKDTELFVFKGPTGTYTRVVALPDCLEMASRAQRILRARVEIFDPGNIQLLEAYVEMYKSFADGFKDPLQSHDPLQSSWDIDDKRREILATILAMCWQYEQHRRRLDIEVYLSSSLTTFRWDLTSSSVIMTQRDPDAPAMLFSRDDAYYRFWETELHASTQMAKRLPLERASSVRLGENPEPGAVREVFELLGVSLPGSYSDVDVNEVIQKALHGSNPYP